MRANLKHVCTALLLIFFLSGCATSIVLRDPDHVERVVEPEPSEIQWLNYYEALTVDPRDDMTVLYFTKTSCSPCDMMDKWTFTDTRVVAALKGYVPVKINGDIDVQLVQRYRIRMFPTIVFAKGLRGEIDRRAGYRNADFMLNWIGDVAANHMTIAALTAQLRQNPEDLEALLGQARNFAEAGEIQEALTIAQKAAVVSPENPDVFVLFGLCHLRDDKIDEAEAALSQALQLDPDNAEAAYLSNVIHLKRGDMALADGDPARARELYAQTIRQTSGDYDAHMGMGRAYMSDKQYEEAFEEFRHAAGLRPNSPAPIAAIGDCYQKIGDARKAEKEFLKAIEVEPRYEVPYFRLLNLYERQGKYAKIMGIYEKILPLEPAGAHNEIAWIMATSEHPEIRDPEAAIRHATSAVEVEPRPWYIDTLAEAYYAKGDHDLAIAIIKEAMAKEPDDMEYYEKQLEKFIQAKDVSGETDQEGK
jgi:tetratricopeptide (TPR) repeat protein